MRIRYKNISGFEGFYRIGTDGSVWSCKKVGGRGPIRKGPWKKLRPTLISNGYPVVSLSKNNKVITYCVHKLVLEAFVGLCPLGMECRHFPDRSKENNQLSNLSWGTPSQNQGDRVTHGTDANGERSVNAKLTWKKVREIRRKYTKYKRGGFTLVKLGLLYGVDLSCIQHIITNRTWKEMRKTL